MNNIPQCKCCGERVGHKKDLPTALLDKNFWKGVCVDCLASFNVLKKSKASIKEIGEYLEGIVQGTLDKGDRKLDRYRAKLYDISIKDMYAAFRKGCVACGTQEDNWTKLSLLFSKYGKPKCVCKACCVSRLGGEEMWFKSLTGEQRNKQKEKSYAECQSKRRMNPRDKKRSFSPYTNVQGFISHARYNPEAKSFPLKGSKVKRYYVDPETLKD